MHLRVYLENPDARAVCHAHPPAATCFAAARRPLDVPILPEAVVNLGRVPVARYATPGSPGVADAVAELCKQGNGLLLANHGVLTWGRHLQQALYCLESLEHTAKIILYGQISECKAVCLTDEEILQLKKLRKKMNGGNQ